MSDWRIRTIGECASNESYSTQIGPFGKALTPEAYVPNGNPLLRGINVSGGGRFHDDDFVFISDSDAERLSKYESFPGDVLLVHKGSLGHIGLMPKERRFSRYIMGNSMLRVRCDPSKLLPEYLRYWLQSPDGQHYLFSRVSQVGVPQIQRPLTTLREAALPVPPIDEQTGIITVLGSLDDKIEQNRRTGAKLEELARAVFKAWFVDFEPVKAKAAGATAFPGMPPETFAALPTSFEDSELGAAPEGWNVVTLRDMATFITGGTPSKKNPSFWNGTFPWVSAKDMHGRIVSDSELRLSDAGKDSVRRLAPRHSTLMVIRGMSLMTEVRIGWCTREVAFNQDLRAFIAHGETTPEFIHLWLASSEETLMRMVDTASHGTGRILTDRLDKMAIARPPKPVMQSFSEIAKPIMGLRESLHAESAKLTTLRDYLLPYLLSGQVHVCGLKWPSKTNPVPVASSTKPNSKPSKASDEFKEAILIAALVRAMATPSFPLGRKRYNKVAYFVHRKAEHDVRHRYLKKAAGPYNPWARYSGPEKIGISNGYLKRVKVNDREGLVPGDKIDAIDTYLRRYDFAPAIEWAVTQFRFLKNDELELRATVDFAAIDLGERGQRIDARAVLELIASEPEWAPKLDREIFSEFHVARALREVQRLFPPN